MPRFSSIYQRAKHQRALWTLALVRPAVWLTTADISTIAIATGVSEWRDKSGNGSHATQATAANQPVYSRTSFFGLPGITFDGSDDQLDISTTRMQNTTHGVFWVFIRRGAGSTGDAYRPSVGVLSTGADRGALHYVKNTNNLGASYPYFGGPINNNYDLGSGTAYDNTTAQVMAFQSNGTGWGVWRNGSLEGTTNGIAAPNTTNTGFILGAQNNPNRKSNITMTEFILFETTDARLRQLIEGYLAWKWRFAHNLSLSHPYRFSPPRDNRILTRRTRTIVSLAGAAGSGGGATVYERTQSDAVGFSEQSSSKHVAVRSQSDPVGLAEQSSAVVVAVRSQSDLVGVSEQSSISHVAVRSQSDHVGVSEQSTAVLVTIRTSADSFGVSEQSTATIPPPSNISSDPFGVSEQQTRVSVYVRSQGDVFGISERSSRIAVGMRATEDPAGVSEQSIGLLVSVRYSVDPMGVSEQSSSSPIFTRSSSDAFGVCEQSLVDLTIVYFPGSGRCFLDADVRTCLIDHDIRTCILEPGP